MKCRNYKKWTDENGIKHQDVVYFGSYGKNEDGTAKFYNENNKNDNYSNDAQGIVESLCQKLSVIKNELWFKTDYGLPLFEKYKSKTTMDAYIAATILKTKNVIEITEFSSKLEKNHYSCTFKVLTKYGNVSLEI